LVLCQDFSSASALTIKYSLFFQKYGNSKGAFFMKYFLELSLAREVLRADYRGFNPKMVCVKNEGVRRVFIGVGGEKK